MVVARSIVFACGNQINQPTSSDLVLLASQCGPSVHRILNDGLSVVRQEKLTLHSITNKASNSSARRRASHKISPPHSSTAFAPQAPPFPSSPGILILRQRVSFVERHLTMTSDVM